MQLPGREDRLGETPYQCLETLIEDLSQDLLPKLDKPFALFGHSLGALIAFETARFLRDSGCPQPVHLFVSGKGAPQNALRPKYRHQLSDADFINELRRLGGTPEEVLQSADLMQMLLPLFRADFCLNDTYVYRTAAALHHPLTVFGGDHDPEVSVDDLLGWQRETGRAFDLQIIHGDHFFLHASQHQIIEKIARQIHGSLGAV